MMRETSRSRAASPVLAAILALTTLMTAPAAWADQPVRLRGDPSAHGPITLGDLFDNAGAAGAVVIGTPAPAGQSAVLDAAAVQRLARQHGLDWDNAGGLQRIMVLSVGGAGGEHGRMVEALTYTHSMMAGDVIQPADLGYSTVPAFSVAASAPRDAQDVIGKMAARPLRAGTPVSTRDVASPLVIKRDDLVQVAYDSDGVSLTMQGKAIASAAVGDPVSVLNVNSKKIIQAIASGPGQAVVGPEAQRVRAASATSLQFASIR
jgi:flagella basal body P-ring formation protein FlgA